VRKKVLVRRRREERKKDLEEGYKWRESKGVKSAERPFVLREDR